MKTNNDSLQNEIYAGSGITEISSDGNDVVRRDFWFVFFLLPPPPRVRLHLLAPCDAASRVAFRCVMLNTLSPRIGWRAQ